MTHLESTPVSLSQPRLVLFATREEYETLRSEAEKHSQDIFTLGASRRLGIPYSQITPAQRSCMKVTFMQLLCSL